MDKNTDMYSRLVRDLVTESAHALMNDIRQVNTIPEEMLEVGIEAFKASYADMKSLYLSRLDATGAMIDFLPVSAEIEEDPIIDWDDERNDQDDES